MLAYKTRVTALLICCVPTSAELHKNASFSQVLLCMYLCMQFQWVMPLICFCALWKRKALAPLAFQQMFALPLPPCCLSCAESVTQCIAGDGVHFGKVCIFPPSTGAWVTNMQYNQHPCGPFSLSVQSYLHWSTLSVCSLVTVVSTVLLFFSAFHILWARHEGWDLFLFLWRGVLYVLVCILHASRGSAFNSFPFCSCAGWGHVCVVAQRYIILNVTFRQRWLS